MEVEQNIFEKIESILIASVPEVKTIHYEKIRISIQGFEEHELPAVQYYEVRSDIEHSRGFEERRFTVALELIMKNSLPGGIVNQFDLWTLRRKIELAIFDEPNLGIPEVIHAIHRGHTPDLHLLDPYHLNTMTLEFLFRRPLTGSC